MLQSDLLTADIVEACAGDGSGTARPARGLARLLWQFSDEVSQTWFSHAQPSRDLTEPGWIDENLEHAMKRYVISHRTRYEYEAPVVHAHHAAYLRPRDFEGQELIKSSIDCEPEPITVTTSFDYFGNACDEIELLRAHDLLEVHATSVVDIARKAFDPKDAPASSWEMVVDQLRRNPALLREREFCFDSPLVRLHQSSPPTPLRVSPAIARSSTRSWTSPGASTRSLLTIRW
jgi:hypothetical protein